MIKWASQKIREEFLSFFKKKGHEIIPSASLIPDDPSVLLTMAGMLPFKKIFLGFEPIPSPPRRTSCQKCLRMNDLENVGRTPRHHTFFEMLGNFSFGDYFKREAIEYAYELLTKNFGISEEKLYVAVFKDDEDSFNIWNKKIGIPEKKIYKLGEDNNFWAVGPTGPCGPCSEIYYDFGDKFGCGKSNCGPGCDCDRFLEIWNLVFMEFNREESGKLVPLPKKNIDTGMGLERIAAVLQGVHSNFETDIFKPTFELMNKIISADKNKEKQFQIYKNIIADHIRAVVFLISDGVMPSNESRGYVLRRLIRRTVFYGHKINIKNQFLEKLAESVILNPSYNVYPELKERQKFIFEVIKNEEKTFLRTLEEGEEVLKKIITQQKKVTGADVFKLYDTYGFPSELTKELVEEAGYKIENESDFEKELDAQKERSRKSVVFDGVYGERPKGGEGIVAGSEEEKINMAYHHSATHLLHAALRKILGPEVEQSGSLVLPDRLRFDFKHPRALTDEEIEKVENLVNEKIRENIAAEIFETTLEEAKKIGALALFDEKYGDKVRVVKFGDFSLELCGGTHVSATGQIGCFKIISDSAISAGFRRIEALAGKSAFNYLVERDKLLKKVTEILKTTPDQIRNKIEKIQQEIKSKEKEIEVLKKEQLKDWETFLSAQKGCVKVFQTPFSKIDDLRKLSDLIISEISENSVIFCLSRDNRIFVARITEDLIKKGVNNNVFNKVFKEFQGKGGGRTGFVQGSFEHIEKEKVDYNKIAELIFEEISSAK